MRRRPPGSTRTDTFPTRRSSDLDDLSRGVRVGVLDVVTVEERVLHDLPVDRLLETFAAHAQQLIEPIARHDLVHLGAQPCGNVDLGTCLVNDPDEAVPLFARELDQTELTAVGITHGVVASDGAKRAINVIGPAV